uniref:Vesicle transport v-SNARE N-terminal domain-containing protein n=1 Tax=Monopterus albus TaxID=43700 RepID=A0A3Q3RDP7_MONAL
MSSDFETYEQDFGTITADITNKIGRIPKISGEEKTQLVLNVDKQLEEVRELLEQMDLEVREIPVQSRAMYNSRLKSYKQEMEKLEKDFKRSRIAYSDEVRNELLGDDASSSESQDHPESGPGLHPRSDHPSHHHPGHLFQCARPLISPLPTYAHTHTSSPTPRTHIQPHTCD